MVHIPSSKRQCKTYLPIYDYSCRSNHSTDGEKASCLIWLCVCRPMSHEDEFDFHPCCFRKVTLRAYQVHGGSEIWGNILLNSFFFENIKFVSAVSQLECSNFRPPGHAKRSKIATAPWCPTQFLKHDHHPLEIKTSSSQKAHGSNLDSDFFVWKMAKLALSKAGTIGGRETDAGSWSLPKRSITSLETHAIQIFMAE